MWSCGGGIVFDAPAAAESGVFVAFLSPLGMDEWKLPDASPPTTDQYEWLDYDLIFYPGIKVCDMDLFWGGNACILTDLVRVAITMRLLILSSIS